MAIQSNFPAIKPSLSLDFANTKRLDSRVTFTRTTTATYYDGVTTAMAEQNLLLQSQTLNITWGTNACSVTADTDTAPDGTSTADSVTEDGTTTFHRITSNSVVLAASTVYTLSVFVKQKTGSRFATIGFNSDGFNYASATFDLSGGTNTQTLSAGYTSVSATITASVNSWYRVTLTATTNAAATTSGLAVLGLSATSTFVSSSRGFDSYAGNSTSAILYWGAQLEQRSSVTAYTATTTQPITNYIPVLLTAASGVARFQHNPTTDESLGLLIEEARTNLLTYSADFSNAAWTKADSSITSNTIVSPDGLLTGDKLVENTTSNSHYIISSTTAMTSGVTYTGSVFAKAAERSALQLTYQGATHGSTYYANFNLANGTLGSSGGSGVVAAITSVGNGWYRCSISAPATTTASGGLVILPLTSTTAGRLETYTGNGYSGIFIWGAQLEAGAFPTSYIATTAATVTRNADVASMTDSNFTSWYNQGEGAIYTELSSLSPLTGAQSVALNKYPALFVFESGNTDTFVAWYGIQAEMGIGNTYNNIGNVPAGSNKFVVSFSTTSGQAASSLNGAAAASRSGALIGTATRLGIGSNLDSLGTTCLNGTIKKLAYYPIRLTNANLQALTS